MPRLPTKWIRLLLLAAVCLPACGCALGRGPLIGPGTRQAQQLQAVAHDPYPDPHIAPEIVGGRPLDYQVGVPETNRARLLREAWWGVAF